MRLLPDAKLASLRAQLPRREQRLIEGAVALRSKQGEAPRIAMRVPFNKRSEVLYGFIEVIDPGAFTKSLQERGTDVVSLWNHDATWVLGRQSNDTFAVRAGDEALEGEAVLDADDQMHQHFARRVERRDVIGSSFGFETVRDRWEEEEDGTTLRTLLECKLYEMSPVAFPAYPDSEAERRSLGDARSLELIGTQLGIDVPEFLRVLTGVRDGVVEERHMPSLESWIGKLTALRPKRAADGAAQAATRRQRLDELARRHGLSIAS